MTKINIKPLTVNQCWQGRRFKTPAYKSYENELYYLLPALKIPNKKIRLYLEFGLSSKNADIDNPIKPFLDVLQVNYKFNDKQIYELRVKKIDVSKGSEYVSFDFFKV